MDPSRDVATFLELAGKFGSLTGYGNDQSGVPLLLDLKPCCRKSLPAAFDSIKPLRSAPLAAATPELPLPNDEKEELVRFLTKRIHPTRSPISSPPNSLLGAWQGLVTFHEGWEEPLEVMLPYTK